MEELKKPLNSYNINNNKNINNIKTNGETEKKTLISSFGEQKNKNELSEILKELFNEDKIRLISDLTNDEIRLITRIEMISEIKDIPIYTKGVEMFMKLKLSRKRMSRLEIIKAVEGYFSSMSENINRRQNLL